MLKLRNYANAVVNGMLCLILIVSGPVMLKVVAEKIGCSLQRIKLQWEVMFFNA